MLFERQELLHFICFSGVCSMYGCWCVRFLTRIRFRIMIHITRYMARESMQKLYSPSAKLLNTISLMFHKYSFMAITLFNVSAKFSHLTSALLYSVVPLDYTNTTDDLIPTTWACFQKQNLGEQQSFLKIIQTRTKPKLSNRNMCLPFWHGKAHSFVPPCYFSWRSHSAFTICKKTVFKFKQLVV